MSQDQKPPPPPPLVPESRKIKEDPDAIKPSS